MIVALEDAKRRLTALDSVLAELKNQLKIDEAKEQLVDLERETMVADFWNDAEKSSKKLQEIKQLKDKVDSYNNLVAKLEDTYTLCEMAIEANDEDSVEEVVTETESVTIGSDALPYIWRGQSLTATGQYNAAEQYTTAACDSVIHVLDLTVLSTGATDEQTVTICDTELPYQWYNQDYTATDRKSVV